MEQGQINTTASQINEVIDKLAEKAGVAAEQMRPLVETVVQEFTARSWVLGIGMLALSLLMAVVAVRCSMSAWKTYKEDSSREFGIGAPLLAAVFAAIGTVGFCCGGMGYIADALSPHYSLLKQMLN
jgi:small-conductance mechanosensitive channel